MPIRRFRIRTLMIAVAVAGAWLALSRAGAIFGAMFLGAAQGACLIQLQKWYFRLHGINPTDGLSTKVRIRLLLFALPLIVAFVPLFMITVTISKM